MPDMIEALLLNASDQQLTVAETVGQLQRSTAHHAPTEGALKLALTLGEAEIVLACLQSPRLSSQQQASLATEGVRTLLRDPLAYRNADALLKSLLEAGGDAQCALAGEPGCVRLARLLGGIEANEQRVSTRAHADTGAGRVLRQCWSTLEQAGVDLGQARAVRDETRRQAPDLGQWRQSRRPEHARKPTLRS